jgi:Lon protease-like protein
MTSTSGSSDSSRAPFGTPLRLFPLPDHVLLPGLPVPYRVFEPRYRAMVEDLLELPAGERWLAVPRLRAGSADAGAGAPAFNAIATAARLEHVSPLPRGHYLIVVEGCERVRLEEVPSAHPYRLARADAWPDEQAPGEQPVVAERVDTLFQLTSLLTCRLGSAGREVREAVRTAPDVSTQIYRLASLLVPDADLRQELLESRQLVERIDLVENAIGALVAALGDARDGLLPSS